MYLGFRKALIVFACLCLLSIGILFTVYAENVVRPTEVDYQRIVDKVNQELGANIQLATPTQIAALKAQGFPVKERPGSLEEFEISLRQSWLDSTAADEEARSRMSYSMQNLPDIEEGSSGPCRTVFMGP